MIEKLDKDKISLKPMYLSDTRAFVILYVEYLKELAPYSKECDMTFKEMKHAAKELVIEYGEDSHIHTEAIVYDKEIIGFVVIGTWPQTYAKNDVYIMQFYVSKPYQRKGVGKRVMELFMDLDYYHVTEDISMFILFGNPAYYFWSKVMKELGYRDLVVSGEINPPTKDDMRDGTIEGKFYYWEPITSLS